MTGQATAKPRGLVYTFYSFKGGVGRSMAVANIAALLARWGKRVLVLDWDLEAPGIEKYFAQYIPAGRGRRDTPGLVDLIGEVVRGREPRWRNHVIRATLHGRGAIDIITAGRDDPDYVSRLQDIDWDDLFALRGFGDVLERMRTDWISEYDFVLVDSRTGITDSGGICTIHLPDAIVALFTANQQSLEGVKDVMERARRAHQAFPVDRNRLLVLPVPARDESDREYKLAEEWRGRFAAELGELFDDWAPSNQKIEDILNLLKVPYFSYWSFGERLPVLEEDAENPRTLAGAFAFLAKLVMCRLDWDKALHVGKPAIRLDYHNERGRLGYFVGRAELIADLDELLVEADADRWVAIIGGPGMGKSALLAAWLTRREAAGAIVPHHFIRRGEYDWDDPAKLVASLVAQLEGAFPQLGGLDAGERMHPAMRLAQALSRVSEQVLRLRGERLVVLIDGLDEYDPPAGPSGDPLAAFLPNSLPAGVRILCASRPRHPHVSSLMARDGEVMVIDLDDPALAADNDATVRAFWDAAAEPLGLDADFIAEASARANGNIQHAVQLRKHLATLRPGQRHVEDIPRGLAALIMRSWERIAVDPIVVDGLGVLCAAREALTLDELGAVVGWTGDVERRAFLRGARELLLEAARPSGGSEYRLHHDSIRAHIAQAIGSAALRAHHDALARRLATWPVADQAATRRYALRHALVHRVEAGDWKGVWQIASDMSFLEAKCRELGAYETEADVARAAARCQAGGNAEIGLRLVDLARSLARESHWLRSAPDAIAALTWNRLRRSGWQTGEIDRELHVPTNAAFLRVRHVATRESPDLVRDLVGHSGSVNACAVTPDGRFVISASFDATLRVWDLESGRVLAVLEGHSDSVNACVVTPDGRRVVSASGDQTLKVWNLDSRRAVVTLRGHGDWISACAMTPDGRCIVSASGDRTLRVWDLATERLLMTLKGHTGWVNACAITADGQRVISASNDGTVKLWDLVTGHPLATLEGHTGSVNACAVTGDGSRVVSASSDRTLKVWDLATGAALATFEGDAGQVRACVVTVDGRRVVSASGDRTLKVWDLDSGQALATLEGHTEAVNGCAVTPDGRQLVSASADRTLKIWDLEGRRARPAREGHLEAVNACAMTPDGWRMVSASEDRTLKVWDLATGRARVTLQGHLEPVHACAVTPDGRRVVSASADGTLQVWELDSGQSVATLNAHAAPVVACAVTPDGSRAVSGSADGTLKVWDMESGRSIATLSGHDAWVRACAVTPDARRVISASNDHTLKVWDLQSGRVLATMEGHAGRVLACVVTPDGRQAISASSDGTLKIWDIERGRARATLRGHAGPVHACAVTGNARYVVSASEDATLRVWDLDTLSCIFTHRGDGAYTAVVATTVIAAGDNAGAVWILDWPPSHLLALPAATVVRSDPVQAPAHTAPSRRPSARKATILFLAANPLGTDRLALDREARAIQVELERSGYRDGFELVTRWAAEPLDLLRELRKLRPSVVHFSGHGNQPRPGSRDVPDDDSRRGLFFQGPDGRPVAVSPGALEDTFTAAGSSVKLVVLDGCYSEGVARAVLAHVDCVVGTRGAIHDDAARAFAIGFYAGLAERESVVAAYRQGRAAISLEGLHDGDRPQLLVRDGVDAERLIVTGDASGRGIAEDTTQR